MKLKNILYEVAMSEPPESVLKDALDLFRKQTNLPVATPTISKSTPNFIVYTTSLDKFVTGALLPLVVTSAELIITVTPTKSSIGGYKFQFYVKFITADGTTSGSKLFTLLYTNNKFKVTK